MNGVLRLEAILLPVIQSGYHPFIFSSSRTVTSQSTNADRLVRLLTWWMEAPFLGSHWWVKGDLWKISVPVYDEISLWDEHPGVSLLSERASSDLDAVPVLYGRSKRVEGGMPIKGLTRREPDRICWFGYRFPVRIPLVQWPTGEPVECLRRMRKGRKKRRRATTAIVRLNEEKPMATEAEKQQLKAWCRRHRLQV